MVKIMFFSVLIVVDIVLAVRETVLLVVVLIKTWHGWGIGELSKPWGWAADHLPFTLRRSVGVRGMQVAMGSPLFLGGHSLFA